VPKISVAINFIKQTTTGKIRNFRSTILLLPDNLYNKRKGKNKTDFICQANEKEKDDTNFPEERILAKPVKPQKYYKAPGYTV
jgi:hypothetical protein